MRRVSHDSLSRDVQPRNRLTIHIQEPAAWPNSFGQFHSADVASFVAKDKIDRAIVFRHQNDTPRIPLGLSREHDAKASRFVRQRLIPTHDCGEFDPHSGGWLTVGSHDGPGHRSVRTHFDRLKERTLARFLVLPDHAHCITARKPRHILGMKDHQTQVEIPFGKLFRRDRDFVPALRIGDVLGGLNQVLVFVRITRVTNERAFENNLRTGDRRLGLGRHDSAFVGHSHVGRLSFRSSGPVAGSAAHLDDHLIVLRIGPIVDQ